MVTTKTVSRECDDLNKLDVCSVIIVLEEIQSNRLYTVIARDEIQNRRANAPGLTAAVKKETAKAGRLRCECVHRRACINVNVNVNVRCHQQTNAEVEILCVRCSLLQLNPFMKVDKIPRTQKLKHSTHCTVAVSNFLQPPLPCPRCPRCPRCLKSARLQPTYSAALPACASTSGDAALTPRAFQPRENVPISPFF